MDNKKSLFETSFGSGKEKTDVPSVTATEGFASPNIVSDFDLSHSEPYCNAYLRLIRAVVESKNKTLPTYQIFLGRVLGFENFVLKHSKVLSPFAAATASFRNPAFLSLQQRGLRKNSRNDPNLLPLVVAMSQESPTLFYHSYYMFYCLHNCRILILNSGMFLICYK